MQNFRALGGSASRPPCLRRLGALPPNPQNNPPLRISGDALGSHKGYALFVCCRPAPNSGQKIGLSLSEDLFFFFFFCSSPDFGQKIGLNLGGTISILIFVLLRFSEVPGPPFQNPAYATEHNLLPKND